MRDKSQVRIFFALWPDEGLRAALHEHALTIPVKRPGRRVPAYNFHLTLHFIGDTSFDEMVCLQQQASGVDSGGFEIDIDCQGYFRRPRVAWLGCRRVPEALQALHQRLGRRLQDCAFRPESRAYNPHITVARKLASAPPEQDFEALCWRVENFVLIESVPIGNGVQYRVVETYPLT